MQWDWSGQPTRLLDQPNRCRVVISRAFEVLPGWRFRLCWSGPRLEALAPKWIRGASVGTQLPVYPARLKARKPIL